MGTYYVLVLLLGTLYTVSISFKELSIMTKLRFTLIVRYLAESMSAKNRPRYQPQSIKYQS